MIAQVFSLPSYDMSIDLGVTDDFAEYLLDVKEYVIVWEALFRETIEQCATR